MALFYTLGLLTYSSLNNVKALLCWLVFVNFDTDESHLGRGTSAGALLPSEWLMGMSNGHFLDWYLM